MTAIRVVTDHQELDNSGQVSHSDIDTYVTGTAFLVVSGSGPLPPAARRLRAGPGITIVDEGPGGHLIITANAGAGGGGIQWNEVPSGSNDGVNKQFTLLYSPSPPSALMLPVRRWWAFTVPTRQPTRWRSLSLGHRHLSSRRGPCDGRSRQLVATTMRRAAAQGRSG